MFKTIIVNFNVNDCQFGVNNIVWFVRATRR